ncbi:MULTISPECIES: AAA family ATPase [Fusobacterium]|uniref:AAA family ATPase n=1 Tax=Fusobacterium TaxID=848 RepID=UPI001F3701E7|nr:MULTISPECIES: AAA family ATPase [Fusobacterium]MCF2613118.1 AAA family ATPase [Fusobacterium perfoetens]MDY2980246.1 AAA family ATPase [Fusobacterium sp.]
MKKLIPDGISDFKTLIENNYYYVDKTPFISEIGKNVGKTLLFTRPRRFGKTLNMSMLKYFFDIKEANENRKLFKNLEIENLAYFKEQGKYPVIFISMKDIKEMSFDGAIIEVKNLLKKVYNQFEFIREKLNEGELIEFDNIWLGKNDENLKNSLLNLATFLKKYYNQKVVVLIDEYDTPLVSAYRYGYYKEAKNFFSSFYSSALKDNNILQVGVITGIVRVIKAGIFSDLNNLSEHSILNKEYDEYFGFLEEEVKNALKYYEIDSKLNEVHSWYNGYKFGDKKVYNPWSILKFLSQKEFKSYWIDTSDNYLIKDILKSADKETFDKLNNLLFGKKVEEEITGKSTLQEVLEAQDLWELLLFSGYLTIDSKIEKNIYSIKIPNKEVKEFFGDSFIEISFGTNLTFKNLIVNLLDNKIEKFESNLQEILLKYMSFYDVSNIEKVYHSFILGLMIHLEGKYKISSNGEGGLGRYDIAIEPLDRNLRGVILEFKVADSEEKLDEKASEGLEQIEDKKYYIELEKRGIKDITFIGMAFYKKFVKIKAKNYKK